MRVFFAKLKFFFRKVSRIISSAAVDFVRNNDYLKASALTFYTLIVIVPFLAVAFGIANGFGFSDYLEAELTETFEQQSEVVKYAIQFARAMLRTTQGNVIAGVGLITLLWSNLSMLGNIESALNDIWKVKKSRSWKKKFADYLAAMIICPLVFVVSSSLSVYVITQLSKTAQTTPYLEFVSPYLKLSLNLIPFVLSVLLFIVIYLFIPNTQVHRRPRIIAGILAGIAFQLWQWIYIKFQVEISSYGAIYGTFAALPLFLIWLQVSWLIVLGGAEVAAHIENEMFARINDYKVPMARANRVEVALLILHRCVQAFSNGDPPLTTLQIAQDLQIPLLTVQQIIDLLTEQRILVEVGYDASRIRYQPSREARLFTIKNISDAVAQHDESEVEVVDSATLQRIAASLKDLDQLVRNSPSNLNLTQL